MIYLDWNATTPPAPEVLEAMQLAAAQAWGNAASVHGAGRKARQLIEDAREALAKELFVLARDVIFTGGGTEANHLALSGARWVVASRLEHPSIVAQLEEMQAASTHVQWLKPEATGVISPAAVAGALEELRELAPEVFQAAQTRDMDAGGRSPLNTPIVCVMAANHETGAVMPIEQIAAVVHSFGAHLHVDAVQLFFRAELEALRLADSVSFSAHKIRGPKSLGALAFACGFNPQPLGRGGAQERGLRPGTQDAAAAAGLLSALRRKDESLQGYRKAQTLRDDFESWLRAALGARLSIQSEGTARLGHVSNIAIEGWKGDELVAALDLDDICVSSGSACSAGTAEPSKVIEAIYGRARAEQAVRISFGEQSSQSDLDALKAALKYHLKLDT